MGKVGSSARLFCTLALAVGAIAGTIHAGAASPASAAPPERIVSLNLCSDQLLVVLADRRQIAGLSANAPDPDLSAVAGRVGGLPILRQSAEQLVAIRPDLVLGTPAREHGVLVALGHDSYRTLDLGSAANFPEIAAEIRRVAAAVGHKARGEQLVRRMAAELERLPRPGRGRVAAYYQRRGFLTGTGTLIDDLMRRVGLVNLAARLGRPVLSGLSLEELVAARPDFLIVDAEAGKDSDQGTEMLHHPALAGIPRLVLPQAWTVCGGPGYVDAARLLATELQRH